MKDTRKETIPKLQSKKQKQVFQIISTDKRHQQTSE